MKFRMLYNPMRPWRHIHIETPGQIEDFQSSGLIDLAAKNYRVIAIDRPGWREVSKCW
jgi:hypothetical protein